MYPLHYPPLVSAKSNWMVSPLVIVHGGSRFNKHISTKHDITSYPTITHLSLFYTQY